MFCPQCGAPNDDESIFCGNCGAVLNPDEMPVGPEVNAAEDTPVEKLPEEGEEIVGEPILEEDWDLNPMSVKPPSPPPAPSPPSPAYVSASSAPTSGLAIASLLLGIGGLTLLPLLGSILALVFGYMARNDIRKRPGQVSGDGLALAGIVLGWIAVGLSVLGLLIGGGAMICGLCGTFGAGSY
jgi:hypothetical protein